MAETILLSVLAIPSVVVLSAGTKEASFQRGSSCAASSQRLYPGLFGKAHIRAPPNAVSPNGEDANDETDRSGRRCRGT